jgi:hypothetical protein
MKTRDTPSKHCFIVGWQERELQWTDQRMRWSLKFCSYIIVKHRFLFVLLAANVWLQNNGTQDEISFSCFWPGGWGGCGVVALHPQFLLCVSEWWLHSVGRQSRLFDRVFKFFLPPGAVGCTTAGCAHCARVRKRYGGESARSQCMRIILGFALQFVLFLTVFF